MKRKLKPKPWYDFKAKAGDGVAELRIYGEIGGGFFFDEDAPSGKRIAEELEALGEDVKTIRVLVNSPGGNLFDGIHIANALRRQREEYGREVDVEIEAVAASAATIVTSAGTTIKMPRNALMMIHNPEGAAYGPRETMLKVAEALERAGRAIVATYRWVSHLKPKKLQELMDATTWMDAAEAKENGLITHIADPVTTKASFSSSAIELLSVPEKYRERVTALFAAQADEEEGELAYPEDATATSTSGDDTTAQADGETDTDTDTDADGGEVETGKGDDEKKDGTAGSSGENVEAATNGAALKGKGTMGKEAEDKKAIQEAEKARITGITNAANVAIAAGLKTEDVNKLRDGAIQNDVSVGDFRESLFEELAKKSDATGPDANASRNAGAVEAGEDERDKRVTGIQAALWQRSGVTSTIQAAAKKAPDHPAFKNIAFDPGEFRGMSLLDHAKDALERSRPGSSRGKRPLDITADFFRNAAAGGYQTTSDFAVALEEALHKTLLAAYTVVPDQWRLFCKVGTVSDFRAHNRYDRGYLARLQEVKEHGEFKNQTLPDVAKEVQQALTYGNILALSRQAIINDDMGVFNDLAMLQGRAAALSIELGVFDLIKLNSGLGPAMNDTVALFDATHGNLNATGSALSVAGIDADRVVMAQQTDKSANEVLNFRPAVLVLPVGLGGEARVINDSQYDHDSTKLQKPNKVRGLFRDIVDSPHLTGTRRYMFADPAIQPVIEVAFLDGEQAPFMEMQDGWRIDGVEWKVRHDFGIAAISYRGCVTNAGA